CLVSRRARYGARASGAGCLKPARKPANRGAADMATIPVDVAKIADRFGPHPSRVAGERLSTSIEPARLVQTHCCVSGPQSGIQLKLKCNDVIGFEPWAELPFTRAMLCPKGVKRSLQGSHPARLLTSLARDPQAPAGFQPIGYDAAIARVAAALGDLQKKH